MKTQPCWNEVWQAWAPVLPFPSSDSCPTCHSWTDESGSACPTCTNAAGTLSSLTPVLPITLFAKPSKVRDALTEYKRMNAAHESEALAAMLSSFMSQYEPAVANYFGSDWDVAVPIPSTRRRSGLGVGDVMASAGMTVCHGLRSTGVPGQHRRYDLGLFMVEPTLPLGRVLLLEDAYVSGARAQTAAATLGAAGISVIGILTLGRRVNPDFNEHSRVFWRRRLDLRDSRAEGYAWLLTTTAGSLA